MEEVQGITPQSVEIDNSDLTDMIMYAEGVDPAEVIRFVNTEPQPNEDVVESMAVTGASNMSEVVQATAAVVEEMPGISVDDIIPTLPEPEVTLEPVPEEVILTTLPENSATLKINEFTSRFNGAVWALKANELDVVLAGCGGIGSWTGFVLSRLGLRSIILYDDDVVDSSNISGQLFKIADRNQYKVTALKQMMQSYSGVWNITTINQKFTSNSAPHKIMICGFDNMSARKTFFNVWYDNLRKQSKTEGFNPKEYIFIDGRLAAEELQVFCLRGDDKYFIKKYAEEYLFSDEEAEPTVCSYKQTSFMSNMIAGIINNLFVNYITNLCDVPLERELPFLTTYQADYMIFNTVH